jgi:hypothetical protein
MRGSGRASIGALATLVVLLATGCDQLNKPFGNTSSSSSSSSGAPPAGADAGELSSESDGGAATPVPSITAQPGDIRL